MYTLLIGLWSLLLTQLAASAHVYDRRQNFNISETTNSTRHVTATIVSTRVITLALANSTTSAIPGTGISNHASNSMNTTSTIWSSVSACNEALLSWSNANRYNVTYYTTQVSYRWSTSTAMGNQSVYYEPCDALQWPRVDGPASVYRVTSTTSYSRISNTIITSNATAPRPTCTINSSGCQYLLSSYSALDSFPTVDGISYEVDLPCTSTCRFAEQAPSFPICTFNSPAEVRLIYFPVTTVSAANASACGNATTISPKTPATVESLGTTFTEGTAYISFAGLAAYDGCDQLTGTSIGNTILALPSSEVSYLCGEWGLGQFGPRPTQLNFADLNYPIPLSLYTCQERCNYGEANMNVWQGSCPIVLDTFAPALGFPTPRLQKLQPEWASCSFFTGIYQRLANVLNDPPIVLTQAASVAKPTGVTEVKPTTTSAQPISQPATPPPATTTRVQPIQSPSSAPSKSNSGAPSNQSPSSDKIDDPPSKTAKSSGADGTATFNLPPASSGGSLLLAPDQSPSRGQEVATPSSPTPPSNVGDPSSPGPALQTLQPDMQPSAAPNIGSSQPAGQSLQHALTSGNVQPADQGSGIVPSSNTFSRSGSVIIVNGQSIDSTSPTSINGQLVSALPDGSGLVVGGTTTLSVANGGQTVIPARTASSGITVSRSNTAIVVNGQPIDPDTPTSINGQLVSVLPDGSGLALGGATTLSLSQGGQTVIPASVSPAPTALSISRKGDTVIVGGVEIDPGKVTTIDGHVVSNIAGGDSLVVDGSTINIPAGSQTVLMGGTAAAVTSFAISRNGEAIVLGSTTLGPGQAATIDGQVISNIPGGNIIAVGGSTIALPAGSQTIVSITPNGSATTFTAASKTWAAFASNGKVTGIVVDRTTITLGGSAVVLGGETFSLGPSGLVEIDASTTSTIEASQTGPEAASYTGDGQRAVRLRTLQYVLVLGLAILL